MGELVGMAGRAKRSVVHVMCIAATLLASLALYGLWSPQSKERFSLAAMPGLAARPLPSDEAETAGTIRFLSARVKGDPDDFIAQSMLASRFLQRLRETNNLDYLKLAETAARASLASVPAERNIGGLAALTHSELASHEFLKARDHAVLLIRLEPGKGTGWALLGDALLELGDYDRASNAFQRMQQVGFGASGVETRLARLALLRGDPHESYRHLVRALALALDSPVPPRETVAWCYWQMGEAAFSAGDYVAAEEHYRAALTSFPGYMNALPSLGRVHAARGDLREAIEHYEHAVRILPDPAFVAGLGDLYKLAGRTSEAESQYTLVEQIGRLWSVNGAASKRPIIVFHADHDRSVDETYASAVEEYRVRHDIYGADALAWSALKAGRIPEAQQAIKAALRLGTQDARLFYHAGMISGASGDLISSQQYLERALALSPGFDLLQADAAKKVLASNKVFAGLAYRTVKCLWPSSAFILNMNQCGRLR